MDSRISYSSGYTTYAGYHYHVQGSAAMSFKFTGTKLRINGLRDGTFITKYYVTIDGVSSGNLVQKGVNVSPIAYETKDLSEGLHTVVIDSENPSGQYSVQIHSIDIDANGMLVANDYTNLTAQASSPSSITLNWDKVDGASGYTVKRSTTVGGPYEKTYNTTENNFIDTNELNPGGTYYYVVAPIINGKEGTLSHEATVTIPLEPTGNATLDILASAEKVKVGQEFTTDVILKNASNIYAEDFKVNYNNTLFEYVGCEQVAGYKLYNTPEDNNGTLRFIIASQGQNYEINNDTTVLKLKFKAKAVGTGKVDALKARIADKAKEYDIEDVNCLEDTIIVEGGQDVNRTGEYTLLDLAIDGYYYGMNTADTDTTKYDADQDLNGKVEDVDLTIIVDQMLKNTNYTPNI